MRPARTIDAAGLVVMPGGIDMHCHIAGPKVNVARKMRPEEKRRDRQSSARPLTHSGTMGSVPSTFATGYKYSGLGYTTAFDAAVPPLAARHAHEEFEDTPCIDKGFYVLMGNNHYVMQSDCRQRAGTAAGVSWPGCWVPPRGMPPSWSIRAASKSGNTSRPATCTRLDDRVDHFDVTPRQIIREMAPAVGRAAACRIPCTSTATIWACPATGRRRWRR